MLSGIEVRGALSNLKTLQQLIRSKVESKKL
jgi:hypothetical protein